MIETCPDEELVKRIDQDMEDMKDEMPFSFRVLVRELIRRYRLLTTNKKEKSK